MTRDDDFKTRRAHLADLSDAELHARFWDLVEKVVEPLVAEARTHTSPSIERSVLLRMGFSSLESKALVDRMLDKGLLAHGAGRLLLELAERKEKPVRDVGLELLTGELWDDLGP